MKCDEIIDLKERLDKMETVLESAVYIIESQNIEIKLLKNTTEYLEHQVDVLQDDLLTLENIVLPEEILPASCFQLAERGETKDGNYKIRPSVDVNPFEVFCSFR